MSMKMNSIIFVSRPNFNWKMKKNNLFIVTSDIHKLDEELKNIIQGIIEKTNKEKFLA
mgnify:CR=1 FL=1